MCNYVTEKAKIKGSGKAQQGWIPLTEARVYFDHPFHMMEEHTLNIDFVDENQGVDARVAVELTADSARALIEKIEAALKFGVESHLTT